jgi:hypothetical protein
MDRHDPWMKHYGRLDKYNQLDKDDIKNMDLEDLLEYPDLDYSYK